MFALGHDEASLLENGRFRQPGKARHGTGTTIQFKLIKFFFYVMEQINNLTF